MQRLLRNRMIAVQFEAKLNAKFFEDIFVCFLFFTFEKML